MVGTTPPLHPRLQHLNEVQLDDLIARYYGREGVRALMNEFDIKGTPSSFVGMLPPVPHQDLFCRYCEGQPLFSSRPSRERTSAAIPFCPRCAHQHHTRCSCKNCATAASERAKQISAHKRAAIRAEYEIPSRADLDIDGLSFRNAVFLLAVFRHSLSEDFSEISPYAKKREPLAPTFEFTKGLMGSLIGARLACVNPESDVDAFVFTDDLSDCSTYYPTKTDWLFLPGFEASDKKEFLASLEQIARDGPWPDHWRFEAFYLWREIAKAECFEYYAYQLSQRGYEAEFGEKTHSVFENLLETFSIGQTFNLTWQAVRDTTDYIVKERLPKYQAKNIFIGSVQRKADRHRAQNWIPHVSRRDFGCPQSIISAVFFEVFMGVGDKALDTLPSMEQTKCLPVEEDEEIPF